MRWIILFLLTLPFSINSAGSNISFKKTIKKEVIKKEKKITFSKQITKTGCFKACKLIVKDIGEISTERIQIAKEVDSTLVITPNYSYLDSLLKLGIPVVVGVHHTFNYGYNENTTDHFVVIIDSTYRFYDVGSKYGDSSKLKFNKINGKLVYGKYTVSQIRKYKWKSY